MAAVPNMPGLESYTVQCPHPFVNVLDAEPAAREVLSSPERILDWVQHSDYPGFKRGLSWLNGAVQGKPYNPRHGFSPESTYLVTSIDGNDPTPTYAAPHKKLRTALLHKAWRAARSMQDVEVMTEMLAVVAVEAQFYEHANKRLGRIIYGLGRIGYNGSSEERQNYSMAVYDNYSRTKIDFLGLHDSLATEYMLYTAPNVICRMGYDFLSPDVDAPAAQAKTRLPHVAAEDAKIYLGQDHFNFLLAMSYLMVRRKDRIDRFVDASGRISTTAILEDMTLKDYSALTQIDDVIKCGYIESIITAYAQGDGRVYEPFIGKVAAPYMPIFSSEGNRV